MKIYSKQTYNESINYYTIELNRELIILCFVGGIVMNVSIWLGWIIVILFAVMSIVILSGKGNFLIAGYNTASKEEKEKYNVKRLNYIVGGGFSLITILLAVFIYFEGELPKYLQWLSPWGYLTIIALILILSNTIGKKK